MLKVITDVSSELITVAEAAEFLRIDANAGSPVTYPNQSVIESLITAVRGWTEEYLYRVIGRQTLQITLDGFPIVGDKSIKLPAPLINTSPISSFTYTDTGGSSVTMVDGTDYYLSSDAEPPSLIPVNNYWPQALKTKDSVKVVFSAGYQSSGSPIESPNLPKTIRTAMLMMIADLFENREAQMEKTLSENMAVMRLLSQYRLEIGI